MSHTEYENHARMKKDYTITGLDGTVINLKEGEVIDTNSNISQETINAFLNPNVGLATDNPAEHNIFRGEYDEESRYYTPEFVNFQGSQYKCTEDTPIPAGVFDLSKWKLEVKGVEHIDPQE